MITVASKQSGAAGEYIGRPSPLGNPFVIGRDGTRDEVCDKYAQWLSDTTVLNLEQTPQVRELRRLFNKLVDDGSLTLVCWCAPQRCHGDEIKDSLLTMQAIRIGEKYTDRELGI